MSKCVNSRNKGFSMVELIIVIAIMVVLISVLAPMYIMYIESGHEAKDLQHMDNAYRLAKVIYTEGDYQDGVTYYFDGNDNLLTTTPSRYGEGGTKDRHSKYDNPCCEQGQYDPTKSYQNMFIEIIFPDHDSEDHVIHVHWTN